MGEHFDTQEMSSALDQAISAERMAPTEENIANAAKAREMGWTEPKGYDYGTFNTTSARGPEDLTEWGHRAAKYEWKDEYGEVGPKVEELEDQLFSSELRNRQGSKITKYFDPLLVTTRPLLMVFQPYFHQGHRRGR